MPIESKKVSSRAFRTKMAPVLDPEKTLKISESIGKSQARIVAELFLSPIARTCAMRLGHLCQGFLGLNFPPHPPLNAVSAPAFTLSADLSDMESIFIEMARCAALNMGEYLPATETFLRLAQTLLDAAEVVSGVIRGAQQAGEMGPSGL
jgi:hypothetical protein